MSRTQRLAEHLMRLSSEARRIVAGLFAAAPAPRDAERVTDFLAKLILVRTLILTVVLGAITWEVFVSGHYGTNLTLVFGTIALTYAVSLINGLLLKVSMNPRGIGYIQLTTDVVLSTFAISAVNSQVAISLYLLAIAAAAVVLNRQGAVIIAALSGLSYALLTSNVLPLRSAAGTSSPHEILFVYVVLVATALVSSYYARELEAIGSLADRNARTLDELSEQQRKVFDDISEGIITLDMENTITGINHAARAILGLTTIGVAQFVGRPLPKVLRDQGIGTEKLLRTEPEANDEMTFRRPGDGEDMRVRYSLRPLKTEAGEATGKLITFADISHVRNMEERLNLHEQMTKLLSDSSPAISAFPGADVEMIGDSAIMQRVFVLVERVAGSDASVLISGESGTGKELIARAVHTRSDRKLRPFIAINCGAIPENLIESELFGHKKGAFTGAVVENLGLFRQAHGGTIFLDEIGELPLQMQTKLLRVLQERMVRGVGDVRDVPVDVRIIAATNRDLKREVQDGRFREDLYYRLNVISIVVPPLRDRKEDIPLLVRHFISQFSPAAQSLPQISPEALQLLMSYRFPGNIRELENIIERALVLGGNAILPEHLPDEVIAPGRREPLQREAGVPPTETKIVVLPIDLEQELEQLERYYLFRALEQSGGVKKHAAELLGLNFRSFRYRLKKYGLSDSDEPEDTKP